MNNPISNEIKNGFTPEEAKKNEETISVSKSDFAALVEKVRQLEEGGIKKVQRVKEGNRTARIRVLKGMPVVSIQNYISSKIMTPAGEENRLSAEIFCVNDKGETVSAGREDFLNFLNESEVSLVNLNKVSEVIDKSYTVGRAKAENPNPVQDLSFSSFDIDLEVEIKESIFNVTVLEGTLKGKIFNINEKALNL